MINFNWKKFKMKCPNKNCEIYHNSLLDNCAYVHKPSRKTPIGFKVNIDNPDFYKYFNKSENIEDCYFYKRYMKIKKLKEILK